MINNYIKDITISNENNYIIVYFNNNIYNLDNDYLNNNNFKLYLKEYNNYEEITIDKIIKNDSSSYSIFFKLKNNSYISNTQIFIELYDIKSNNNEILNNIQKKNSIYLNTDDDDTINTINYDITKNNKTVQELQQIQQPQTPYINYINKSSPMLAYNNNKIMFYKNQISKYNDFYGKRVPKYPKSYYETSYSKIFKPQPQS